MKNRKRILSVKIKRIIDTDPDTSYLGEYSNKKESEYSIDRAHSEDCASLEANHSAVVNKLERILQYLFEQRRQAGNDETEQFGLDEACDLIASLQDDVKDCDCRGGDMKRNEYRYFNGPIENYKGEPPEDIRKCIRQDYDRMERLQRGDWHYIGIRAEAEVQLTSDIVQRISSGGVWGIESDSDKSYYAEVQADELWSLKAELRAMGFSTRAISQAFKSKLEDTQ